MGRYDWLYALEPVPLKTKLLEMLSEHLAEELGSWPPPIEDWLQEADRRRFEPLYLDPRRPGDGAFRYAFHLVRLELRRAYEAIDHEMRNDAWADWFDDRRDLESVHLLVRWLLDVLLAVKEATSQRLGRDDLETVVDGLERRLVPPPFGIRS